MASMNPFERFGIKEVQNVAVIAIADDPRMGVTKGQLVVFLDSLKISTLEQTAETTYAEGGWGNNRWIAWDHTKQITYTLQDALMSPEAMGMLLGATRKTADATNPIMIPKTEKIMLDAAGKGALKHEPATGTVVQYYLEDGTRGNVTATGDEVTVADGADQYAVFNYQVKNDGSANGAIRVGLTAEDFAGTYRFEGQTKARNTDGKDYFATFIIYKGKIGANVTMTMEAAGDASVWDIPVDVLKPDTGNMVEIIFEEPI